MATCSFLHRVLRLAGLAIAASILAASVLAASPAPLPAVRLQASTSAAADPAAPASPAAGAGLTAAEGVIAYVRRAPHEIRLIQPDGANDRSLWASPNPDSTDGIVSLAWRPDGSQLAFSSDHEQDCSWYDSDVYSINANGQGLRRVTNGPLCARLPSYPQGAVTVNVTTSDSSILWAYVMGSSELKQFSLPAWGSTTLTFEHVADLGPGVAQPPVGIWGHYRYLSTMAPDVLPGKTVYGGNIVITKGNDISDFGTKQVTWNHDGSLIGYTMANCAAARQLPPYPPDGVIGADLVPEGIYPCLVDLGTTEATAHHFLYSTALKGWEFSPSIYHVSPQGTEEVVSELSMYQKFNFYSTTNVFDLQWLQDGSGFLFVAQYIMVEPDDPNAPCMGTCSDVFEYDFASGALTQLTRFHDDSLRSLSISPDGQQLVVARVFGEFPNVTGSVWVVGRDGTGAGLLVDNAWAAAWGPAPAPPESTATPTATASPTPTATATRPPGPTATPTSTATRIVGAKYVYLPLVLKSFVAAPATSTPTSTPAAAATATPTRTPTNTPTATVTVAPSNDGIHGGVTFKGAAAPGIELQLRFYDGSQTTTAATTTTDSEGRYRFTSAASLGSGQEYWVRFRSPDNPAYVSWWQTASITAYTSGSAVPGGDFDIADVDLLSPPDDATQALPVTFTWQQRGIPTDTYRLAFFDLDTDEYRYTDDLGNVGSHAVTSLWPDAVYGKEYGWVVWVFNGPDSFGESYYYQSMTFLAGGASSPAAPGQWQIGEEPRQ